MQHNKISIAFNIFAYLKWQCMVEGSQFNKWKKVVALERWLDSPIAPVMNAQQYQK